MAQTIIKQNTISKLIDVLEWTADFFKKNSIKSARLDAEVLLAHVLGMKRLDLYLNFERHLTEEERIKYKNLVQRRKDRIPVAYLIGDKEFMGLSFKVNNNVLIPRPETELLVEQVISRAKGNDPEKGIVIDVFTGSGNIAISLAKNMENVAVYGIDIDDNALKCAEQNAVNNIVADKVNFIKGDVLKPLCAYPLKNSVDIITANPPYIKTGELAGLEPEVQNEPKSALDGGDDGLDFYKRLIKESKEYLKKDGLLAMEIGADLKGEVVDLLEEYGYKDINVIPDYAGLDRVIVCKR
ncbi:MAG: peptide chain release factor N(5)-glutamine methyltransferase [Elusimicrobiota bacterium]